MSDCYWIKHKSSAKSFEQASPYFVDFWKGIGEYKGGAIPSLYVGGVIAKYWNNKNDLIKVSEDCKKEVLAAKLCEAAGIPCVSIAEREEGICVKNFTNPNQMLEQADASGKFDSENFTDFDVVEIFGKKGVEMLTIDAITVNTDRHAGNFGFLRDANTGDYLGMAPLYDFDQILGSNNPNDLLVQGILQIIEQFPEYREKVMQIAKTAINTNLHPVFTERAQTLLNILDGRELQ